VKKKVKIEWFVSNMQAGIRVMGPYPTQLKAWESMTAIDCIGPLPGTIVYPARKKP
jgi:hypothetical protein